MCQVLCACEKPQLESNTASKPQTSPNQFVLENVSAERFSKGERKFQATARRANIDRRSGKIVADEVVIHTKDAKAEAREASGNLNEENVYFEKDIVVTDQTGRIIRTEQATFNTSKSLLVSNSTVTLEGENFSAKGRNLEANFQNKTIKVNGPLKSIFTPQ
ncbi:MAG: LPS export ABC transporter periplasmic protein LptC [Myxococcota bacterium]|nr:LPS export ABC transporter periplasmic protein LptC [Myxococcota bacterium]